jgi:cytochrome c oxidase subunit IV
MSTAPAASTDHAPTSSSAHMPLFDDHDKQYLLIALGLAVLTAIEVSISYTSLKKAALALPLLALAGIKFVIVAGYFMHLKKDSPLFRRLFIMGAVLAGFCYMAVLSAFKQFTGYAHWIIYGVFALGVVTTWALTGVRRGGSDSHDDHSHDAHSHDDALDHAHNH